MMNRFKKKLFAFVSSLFVGSSFSTSGFLGFDPKDEGYVGGRMYVFNNKDGVKNVITRYGDIPKLVADGTNGEFSLINFTKRSKVLLNNVVFLSNIYYKKTKFLKIIIMKKYINVSVMKKVALISLVIL